MPDPVLADVTLPNRVIEAGVRGRQLRRNSRVSTVSGFEAINIVWTQTLREYELGIAPMRREAWQDIEALHEITEGGAYGFLLEDPKDGRVGAGQGVASALGGGTYQLEKLYTHAASGRTKRRKITRPHALTFAVSVAGVPLAGGAYSLDFETGILTIAAAPDAADITWTGRFFVPVRFLEDSIDWTMVATGPDPDARFLAGPSVVLQEIRE